jgi:hypothetical protein
VSSRRREEAIRDTARGSQMGNANDARVRARAGGAKRRVGARAQGQFEGDGSAKEWQIGLTRFGQDEAV